MNLDDVLKKNKEVYNTISDQFAQTRKFLWDDLKPLSEYISDGDVVLDLGCGTGRLYQLFQNFQGQEGVFYTGIDNSEGQIAMAKKQFPEASFLVGDMLALPFEDTHFNTIYSIAAFHHLADEKTRLKALEEMKRVLKPGGQVIMTNWNLSGTFGSKKVAQGQYTNIGDNNFLVPWKDSDGKNFGERFYHSFSREELNTLFVQAGFEVEKQYYTNKGKESDKAEGENLISIISL
jgi:ubiquinone/menaquinone biosynthesis C-methylase UbiE